MQADYEITYGKDKSKGEFHFKAAMPGQGKKYLDISGKCPAADLRLYGDLEPVSVGLVKLLSCSAVPFYLVVGGAYNSTKRSSAYFVF